MAKRGKGLQKCQPVLLREDSTTVLYVCALNLEEHSIYSFKSADFLTYILKQRHNLTHQQHSCLVLTDVDAAREAEKDLFALMQPVTRDVSTNFRPRENM